MRRLICYSICWLATVISPGLFQQHATLVNPPQPATKQVGDNVQLDCAINGPNQKYFTWKRDNNVDYIYDVTIVGNSSTTTTGTDIPAERFQRVNGYGLLINQLTLNDGARYTCNFQPADVGGQANVTVVDSLMLNSTSDVMNVSSVTNFTCSVTFGGPDASVVTLQLALGDRTISSVDAPLVDRIQSSSIHTYTRTWSYEALAEDSMKQLTCTLSTTNVVFTRSSSLQLLIQTPVLNVVISPTQTTPYRVGATLTCTASSYPSPEIWWQAVYPSGAAAPSGSVLTIRTDMIGTNTWKCYARNILNVNPVYREITFIVTIDTTTTRRPSSTSTVAGGNFPTGAAAQESTKQPGGLGQGGKIGLGVGLGIGIPVLIIVIILIVCLVSRKRQRRPKEPDRPQSPPAYDNHAGPQASYQPQANIRNQNLTTPPPEYNPRSAYPNDQQHVMECAVPVQAVMSGPSGRRNTGYADLGPSFGPSRAVPPRYDNTLNSTQNASMDRSLGRNIGPKVANKKSPSVQGYNNTSFDAGSDGTPVKKPKPRPRRSLESSEADIKPAVTVPRHGRNRKESDDDPVFVVGDRPTANNLSSGGDTKFVGRVDEPKNKLDESIASRANKSLDNINLPAFSLPTNEMPLVRSTGRVGSYSYLDQSFGSQADLAGPVARSRKPVVDISGREPPLGQNNQRFDGGYDPMPVPYPRRSDQSFESLHDPHDQTGSVGSTAPLVRQGRQSVDNLCEPGLLDRPFYSARGDRSFDYDGQESNASYHPPAKMDKSFDDNVSFTAGSRSGSLHDISSQSNQVLQFKTASRAVDV